MNPLKPTDLAELFRAITDEIKQYGRNYAPIPIAIAYEDSQWNVWIDVRMSKTRTFDFQVGHSELEIALHRALAQLRREIH